MKDLSAISLMSAPAANALSEPVMTMQPMSAIGLEAVDGVGKFAHQRGVKRVERLRAIEPDRARPARGFRR